MNLRKNLKNSTALEKKINEVLFFQKNATHILYFLRKDSLSSYLFMIVQDDFFITLFSYFS